MIVQVSIRKPDDKPCSIQRRSKDIVHPGTTSPRVLTLICINNGDLRR